ncbi:ATP-binding protein [Chryseobacterium turcicum]|uniref:histidine kinase n=1 Tax=Chryseobacterium turcicum TaxID=2898076 RepID=A0A9Q3V504_9FLAO|nr:sensor histidine kinase [Chryseobacterium turcicum]MCD1118201.1 ATP-binding protein [Chryseobacterium turcicum]
MNNIQDLDVGFYKIRPAARIIHTIGSDLIGDSYSALIELVKNSYDADASKVNIIFEYRLIDNEKAIIITVEDDGHGMNFSTVINKWLVPATDDKLQRKISPARNRQLQGRKGIGRFAASILGQEMTLSSVDLNGQKSTAVIDWRLFNSNDYLENVDILVEKTVTDEKPGTTLKMIAKNENKDDKISVWDKKSIDNLIQELRKLISPFSDFEEDNFDINLSFINSPFSEFNNTQFKIETYPIIKYYDYRISGTVDKNGKAILKFEDNLNPESIQYENIEIQLELEGAGKHCGLITIDYRVFDREPEAISNLINKGLINPVNNKFMGKNEARRLLNEVYGVNIYKNSFRIRPYGNGGVDWLDLDKDRIQNPAQKISNNQVVGFISIQSEELSGLEEKSARDGLKENEFYLGLKEFSKKVLSELETRRFIIRKKSNKSRGIHDSFQDKVNSLFSLNDVKSAIDTKLKNLKVTEEARIEITEILEKEEQKKQSLRYEIEKTIAIYQGQATLGKIVNFILHEGRKPIQFFNSETTVLERYIRHYISTKNEEVLTDLLNSIAGFKTNSKIISGLFKRINPLAKQNRGPKENFNVKKVIENCFKIFNTSLIESNIEIEINCDQDLIIYGWEEDLYTALTNLIENSIYWLGLSIKDDKKIITDVSEDSGTLIIDFRDNGSGLSHNEIESDIIFEPGYSKKLNGTGLGLAISGEAVERLNGKLSARKYSEGAYFQIEINK